MHTITRFFKPLVLAMLLLAGTTQLWSQTVFINEIHYDNAGTDAGEAVEIAGPAGTDLTGWSLVLYNGNGGATYDTDALSGTIPDGTNGYGLITVNYPSNGIQNGAPDGIALVDNNGTVVQFLSYEGAFTAAGGPANGLTSTDIGVSETGSEPAGQSLQLTGNGTTYTDFTWSAASASTFGTTNTGQTFGNNNQPSIVLAPASLGFGEVLVDSTKTLLYTVTGNNLTDSITVTSNNLRFTVATDNANFSASVSLPGQNRGRLRIIAAKPFRLPG